MASASRSTPRATGTPARCRSTCRTVIPDFPFRPNSGQYAATGSSSPSCPRSASRCTSRATNGLLVDSNQNSESGAQAERPVQHHPPVPQHAHLRGIPARPHHGQHLGQPVRRHPGLGRRALHPLGHLTEGTDGERGRTLEKRPAPPKGCSGQIGNRMLPPCPRNPPSMPPASRPPLAVRVNDCVVVPPALTALMLNL